MTEETVWKVCKVKRATLKFSQWLCKSWEAVEWCGSLCANSSSIWLYLVLSFVSFGLCALSVAVYAVLSVSLDYLCNTHGYMVKERDNAICSLLCTNCVRMSLSVFFLFISLVVVVVAVYSLVVLLFVLIIFQYNREIVHMTVGTHSLPHRIFYLAFYSFGNSNTLTAPSNCIQIPRNCIWIERICKTTRWTSIKTLFFSSWK